MIIGCIDHNQTNIFYLHVVPPGLRFDWPQTSVSGKRECVQGCDCTVTPGTSTRNGQHPSGQTDDPNTAEKTTEQHERETREDDSQDVMSRVNTLRSRSNGEVLQGVVFRFSTELPGFGTRVFSRNFPPMMPEYVLISQTRWSCHLTGSKTEWSVGPHPGDSGNPVTDETVVRTNVETLENKPTFWKEPEDTQTLSIM